MRPFAQQLLARLTPKRRWFQFRLRTLLLLMTVLAVWLGVQADRARRQARTLRAIKKSAQWVYFDYQMPGPGPWTEEDYHNADICRDPPGPAWLRRLIGDDYFRTVVGVGHLTQETIPYAQNLPQLGGCVMLDPGVQDEDLAQLAGLKNLQEIQCYSDPITDEGLRHLQSLTGLENLRLSNHITGVGLVHLCRLPKLRSIFFDRGATPAGLRQACALPALQELCLCNCAEMRDDDLRDLGNATHLKQLRLSWLPISDAGLECLEHLPHLKLSHIRITNQGLTHLTGLQELEVLVLERLSLSDAGLEHLSGLSQLRRLVLRDTFFTQAGFQRLRQAALPKLQVIEEPSHP